MDALLGGRVARFTLEWWNEQVTAWTNAVLWVPHHVGAFVATLTGFLLLRDAEQRGAAARAGLAVVCGLAFASAAGMSVWVTLTFALFWALWIVLCLVRGWRAEVAVAVAAGAVAVAVAAPFLVELARANMLHERPIAFAVRSFVPLDRALDASGAGDRRRLVYRLAALPLNYAVELGFFALAAVFYWLWRARERTALTRGELGVLVLGITGLGVASFLKSAIRSNDLGWRSIMFAQFAMLLWATDVAPALRVGGALRARMPARARGVLVCLMVLGGATVAYDLLGMKLYPVGRVAGARFFGTEPWSARESGRRMYDLRAAYDWIDHALPPNAVVQPNPRHYDNLLYLDRWTDVFHGLYANRQAAAGDPEYGTLYGVRPVVYDSTAGPITAAFTGPGAASAARACVRYDLSALLVRDSDPTWRDRTSWVWRVRPLFANATTRVIACADLRP